MIALLLFFTIPSAGFSQIVKLDSLSIGHVWAASQLLPGAGQVINKDYWKIPVFYSGMGSTFYMGWRANKNYHRTLNQYNSSFHENGGDLMLQEQYTKYRIQRNIFYAGTALFYISSVADALIVHSADRHSATTASVLSMLLPGMGQVYNQKLWKVPIITGGFATLGYIVDFNQRGYKRFGDAYSKHPYDEFGGRRSKEELKYLRDGYRRNRDLSIIVLAGFYLLNIIDASVDAHFFDWDISDDLALKLEPSVSGMAIHTPALSTFSPSFGLKLSYSF